MKKLLLLPALILLCCINANAQMTPFTSNVNNACAAPLTVTFNNQNNGFDSYFWDFGDATTDTAANPVHIYTTIGMFTVKLYTFDIANNMFDSLVIVNFINIDPTLTCVNLAPTQGNTAATACYGILYDNGGPGANYSNGSNRKTISPLNATSVSLIFKKFNLELVNDSVEIFDGATTNATKIGTYYGNALPNNGFPITSTGGSITVRLRANTSGTANGFEAVWQCVQPTLPTPVASFISNDTLTCRGTIAFKDLSTNIPTTYFWDFGDGSTSTIKNPKHVYANGTYDVFLRVTNSSGTDSITKFSYVTVNRPAGPTSVTPGSTCLAGQVLLGALPNTAGNQLNWYATDTSVVALGIGTQFLTQSIATPTNFYVEELIPGGTVVSVGRTDSAGFTGGINNTSRFMIFNSTEPCIIQTVKVYADTAGSRTFELRNAGGTVLQTLTTNLLVGMQLVTLNFNVPTGTGLRLGVTGNLIRLYRNLTGGAYPYVGGPISITGNTANSNAVFYFMYDWQVATNCQSLRTPVLANTGSITPYAYTNSPTTICTGDTAVLNAVQGTGYNYSWMESGIAIAGATNATYNATSAGSYTCTISASNCASVTTAPAINITVNAAPTSAIVLPTNDTAYRCLGVPFTLKADTGNGTNTYQWYRNGTVITNAFVDTFTVINGGGLLINTYTVETFGSGCSIGTLSAPFTLYSYTAPTAAITASTQSFCNVGETAVLTTDIGSVNTYQWSLNGSIIAGAQSNVYTATALGSYTVTVDNGYCPIATSNPLQITLSNISAGFTYNAGAGTTIAFTNTSIDAVSYSWTFGDGTGVTTTQNPTHVFADTLVHTVTLIVTSAGGCKDTITQVIDVHPSGIYEVNNSNAIGVYPIPTSDNITITVNENLLPTKAETGFIYNTLGEVVKTFTITKTTQTIDISNLDAGSYMLRIGNINKRIVKE